MKINEITISNFLSFGESQKLDLRKYSSPCLVEGKTANGSNGAGKSSFAQAIYWALTGQLTRDIKASDIIRKGTKSCSVDLKFELGGKNYHVYRVYSNTKKGVDIYIDGEEHLYHEGKAATEFLFESFGFEKNLLETILFFGKGFPTFTESKNADKVALIEQITNVEQFDRLIDRNNNELKIIDKDSSNTAVKQQYINDDINKLKLDLLQENESIKVYKENNDYKIKEMERTIASLLDRKDTVSLALQGAQREAEYEISSEQEKAEIKLHNQAIHELRERVFDHEDIYQKYIKNEADMESAKRNILQDIDRKKREKQSGKCSTCGQTLPHYTEGVAINIDEQIKSLQQELNEVNQDIIDVGNAKNRIDVARRNFTIDIRNEVDKRLDLINKLNRKIETKQSEVVAKVQAVNKLKMEINNIEQQITSQKLLITSVQNDSGLKVKLENVEKIKNKIVVAEQKKIECDNLYNAINKRYLLAKFWETGLKDIKYSAFQNSLTILQDRIAFYLRKMKFDFDSFVIEAFKEGSANKKLTAINAFIVRGSDSIAIGALSQGEAQRVNLAFYFAVKRIIQEYIDVSINISFLDEVVDNVDADGRDCIFQLINEYANEYGSQIFEMNHFPDSANRYNSILRIKKVDDVSMFA